jgi:hypothetical protein
LRKPLIALILAATVCASPARGQSESREPHIGYLYPAGGRQDTTFRVIVGGQFLQGMEQVHVSGDGVSAKVLQHFRMPRRVKPEERVALLREMIAAREKRLAEMPKATQFPPFPGEKPLLRAAEQRKEKEAGAEMEAAKPPDHPMLYDLENKSLRELWHIADEFFNRDTIQRRQLNPQLAEAMLIEVTVGPDAKPGDRELRLQSRVAMTNPMPFQVGTLPEVVEHEPNNPDSESPLPKEAPLELPVLVNGQIMPGDIDRFEFRAKKGQRLVIETNARRLVPFLPDAVPGWFQATTTLYDAAGRELAFADDYRFNPDPVLLYEVTADGVYELEVRDAVYRGREDFVYRVSAGELPFITSFFPLGGRMGVKTVAEIGGWNLPVTRVELDTSEGTDFIRRTALPVAGDISNEITYAVDTLPEFLEAEPNDDAERAQRTALPRIVNGRIDRPGDADTFAFVGRAGDEVVAEVHARRLGSPLDAALRLMDASGKVLQWNDDQMLRDSAYLHRDMGLLTHHADPYLAATLPEDGTYTVQVIDAQRQGGAAYAYRLRLSAPRPDFELRMTPSSLCAPAGRILPFTVFAQRCDGFEGEIEVALKDAPEGFLIEGGRIPAGRDSIRMTLRMPEKALKAPVALTMEGRAVVGGETLTRPVTPCEDVMQAFLYRHLLPSRELLAAAGRAGRGTFTVAGLGDEPVRIPAGGSSPVFFKVSARALPDVLDLELQGAPEGLTLQDVAFSTTEISFRLKAEGAAAKPGSADNAIVELFTERTFQPKGKDGEALPPKTRRLSLGVLPAVPYVITEP